MPHNLYNKALGDSGKGLRNFLGELELTVMEVIWQHQPLTVADALGHLNTGERTWAYTTIMTIMNRLAAKGWLNCTKQGRALVYPAAFSRQEAEARLAGDVVRRLLEDFGDVAVAQFALELERTNPDLLSRLTEIARDNDDDTSA
jgi:predicted transcriptional regulator